MRTVNFRGVSGTVQFSDTGDRLARTQVEQLQDGRYVQMGFYDAHIRRLDWLDRERFVGGRTPPPDSTRVRRAPITVNFLVEFYDL
jgi:gamma-aminobutyric acid type B receptor